MHYMLQRQLRLRVEEIPSTLAELEEFVAFCPLGLRAVPAFAEWAAALGGAARPQWWAAAVFIFGPCPSSAGTPGTLRRSGGGRCIAVLGRGWCGRLVAAVVHELR